ncbi:MAG: hypothetical protein KKD38_00350, partial [Candidatus Delongbacteria bacterium]|nr:hypothetical protein [Candidatus Delongbacteria bacterium]
KVITEDLIGYDSMKDNFNLLIEYSKDAGFNELSALINSNRNAILEESYFDSTEEIKNALDFIKGEEEKLNFLLKHNRHFQFNGYIAEQKNIVELIEKNIDISNWELKQKYYSDLSFVYFKDFFFEDSKICLKKLLDVTKNKNVSSITIKNIYNIALFRIFFYKQRLAFGPFLSIGIMISLLCGNLIIDKYYGFLERLFL